jgi:hypothetical protein
MQQPPKTNSLTMMGAQVGLTSLTNLSFDPSKPYSGCRLCGALFQSAIDRDPIREYFKHPDDYDQDYHNVLWFALDMRKEWTRKHAKLHSEKEHNMLRISGRWATPEASERLATMGVFSVTDLVLDNEVSSALAESPRVPTNDAEDHVRRNNL